MNREQIVANNSCLYCVKKGDKNSFTSEKINVSGVKHILFTVTWKDATYLADKTTWLSNHGVHYAEELN